MYSAFTTDGGGIWHYGSADVYPAYEVTVNPVPEPVSLAVVTIGSAILLRRRKRSG